MIIEKTITLPENTKLVNYLEDNIVTFCLYCYDCNSQLTPYGIMGKSDVPALSICACHTKTTGHSKFGMKHKENYLKCSICKAVLTKKGEGLSITLAKSHEHDTGQCYVEIG